MATIAERLFKLGLKLAPILPWIIAHRPATYQDVYDNNQEFKDAVNNDDEIQGWTAGELSEALAMQLPSNASDD
jgi:hypothetical protein